MKLKNFWNCFQCLLYFYGVRIVVCTVAFLFNKQIKRSDARNCFAWWLKVQVQEQYTNHNNHNNNSNNKEPIKGTKYFANFQLLLFHPLFRCMQRQQQHDLPNLGEFGSYCTEIFTDRSVCLVGDAHRNWHFPQSDTWIFGVSVLYLIRMVFFSLSHLIKNVPIRCSCDCRFFFIDARNDERSSQIEAIERIGKKTNSTSTDNNRCVSFVCVCSFHSWVSRIYNIVSEEEEEEEEVGEVYSMHNILLYVRLLRAIKSFFSCQSSSRNDIINFYLWRKHLCSKPNRFNE